MVIKRPRSKPIALPPLIPGTSGSRRWLFWVSSSLIGLALGHKWTKYYMLQSRKIHVCLRVLVVHGHHGQRLIDVVRATTLAWLLYASSVWWGFAIVGEHKRLNGILRKMTRPGFLPSDFPSFDKHCSRAYSTLFRSILLNRCNVQFIHIIKSYFFTVLAGLGTFISKSSVKHER